MQDKAAVDNCLKNVPVEKECKWREHTWAVMRVRLLEVESTLKECLNVKKEIRGMLALGRLTRRK